MAGARRSPEPFFLSIQEWHLTVPVALHTPHWPPWKLHPPALAPWLLTAPHLLHFDMCHLRIADVALNW